jgi:hypothetical protein
VKHRRAPVGRWLACIVALALALGVAGAAPAADTRELDAREAFAAGRYQQALDLFAKLYAETLHPVYLRNIGRCYQYLGNADQALISFRDYLRKHKTISAEERTEVEGFIADMEALKKQKAGETGPPAETPPAPPPASTITALPPAPEPPAGGTKPEVLVAAPAKPTDDASPVTTRGWFWALVGAAAVGAGLGIAAGLGAFTTTKAGQCLPGYDCQ